MRFLRKISSSSSTDADLVKEYQETEKLEVLSELYQRYMELVYGVCLKYLVDGETAKDAVMNIFEELVVKLRTHKVDHVKGWLHTVARNHCLMYLRSAKNLKFNELNEEFMQMEESLHLNGIIEKEQQLDHVALCMKTLPNEQQQCIDLFYLQSKSYNEIAEMTGFDWKSVRSYIQNGRRNLKICMEKQVEVVRPGFNDLATSL